jgi:outer membrane immunogenic protein
MNLKSLSAVCVAGCGLALASTTPLYAAEIPAPTSKYTPAPYVPPLTFEGFYIGGHIGGAWADLTEPSRNFFLPGSATAFPIREGNLGKNSFFGGVQGGYNFQSGPWVYGIELDLGGVDALIKGRDFHIAGPVAATFADLHEKEGAGLYGDVTGRIGYSWGSAMVYAKGGFAYAVPNFSTRETLTVAGVASNFGNNDNSETLTGWTAGGGIEYLISPNWSLKAEYLYFDFSNNNNNGCCFDGTNNFRFFDRDLEVHTVKVGFNYFFHPDYVPLK